MDDRPPGYRFYPTEEELVSFYLSNQLEGKRKDMHHVIPVLDIYDFEPWHLPKWSGEMCKGDIEQWFYFVPRQEKEARGGRPNRSTASGYWKATGSPGYVYSSDNRVIGVKKAMVFYKGKAPTGRKTKWKMNEYRAIQQQQQQIPSTSSSSIPKLRHEFSLCRVYVVSGSFRAFDRRPLKGKAERETNENTAAASSQNTIMPVPDRDSISVQASSTENSFSGDHPDAGGSTNWVTNECLPIDWEHLDWL